MGWREKEDVGLLCLHLLMFAVQYVQGTAGTVPAIGRQQVAMKAPHMSRNFLDQVESVGCDRYTGGVHQRQLACNTGKGQAGEQRLKGAVQNVVSIVEPIARISGIQTNSQGHTMAGLPCMRSASAFSIG